LLGLCCWLFALPSVLPCFSPRPTGNWRTPTISPARPASSPSIHRFFCRNGIEPIDNSSLPDGKTGTILYPTTSEPAMCADRRPPT
jgi:hypothetical protein